MDLESVASDSATRIQLRTSKIYHRNLLRHAFVDVLEPVAKAVYVESLQTKGILLNKELLASCLLPSSPVFFGFFCYCCFCCLFVCVCLYFLLKCRELFQHCPACLSSPVLYLRHTISLKNSFLPSGWVGLGPVPPTVESEPRKDHFMLFFFF